MNARLSLAMTVLAAVLGACVTAPAPAPRMADAGPAPLAAEGTVGRSIDDIVAANGPPSQQWDLPDGRRVYQWQQTSLTASVAEADARGEVVGGATQTTCSFTLYTRQEKGRWTVVAYDPPRPGCMKVASNINPISTR